MANLSFSCPKCGQLLNAPETAVGKGATCPKCSTHFTIPGSGGSRSAAPVRQSYAGGQSAATNRNMETDSGFFEYPFDPQCPFLCSDNSCPCPGTKRLEPGVEGCLYICKEMVDYRRGCKSWEDYLEAKRRAFGPRVFYEDSAMHPIFMCKEAAKKRGLDVSVALNDAKLCKDKGVCPLRPTPTI